MRWIFSLGIFKDQLELDLEDVERVSLAQSNVSPKLYR